MYIQQLLAMHHHTFITHAVEIELNAWTRCHGYIMYNSYAYLVPEYSGQQALGGKWKQTAVTKYKALNLGPTIRGERA